VEFVPITVVKRDGKRESFDRSKLLRGIVRATEKTGIPLVRLEALVDELEAELQQKLSREVSSGEIGELVLSSLRAISEVAYIRFASVYRQFQGIKDFVDTLNLLQNESSGSSDDSADADYGSSGSGFKADSDDHGDPPPQSMEIPTEISTSVR
jgi:transcriptional repressor NrdR